MRKTRTAADSGWRRFQRSETDADVDLRFSYACGDTSDSNYRIYAFVRRPDASNWVAVFLYPGWAKIVQRIDGASYQYLDTEAIATTEDAWYDVRVVADGANVTVWRGEKGGAMEKILETSSASITTTSYLRFENAPYSDYRVDDIRLVGGSLSNITTAFAYDSGNELSTRTVNSVTTHFTYDAWGRMASKYVADGVSASYAWRYGDKLYSVTSNFPGESSVTYDYGGDQKRRERTANGTSVKYNWDLGWNLINQETSGGTLAESYVVQNPNAEVAMLLGMVSGSNPSTGAYAYFVHDHLGSVRAVYEASKTLTGDYAYTPYGSIYAQAGATAITDLPAAFTGKPLDPATGLYSFPYRIYSPDLARWLSRDPLGMVDGPNVYGYVHNDPTASRDLSGLDADDGAFSGGCGDLLENCVRNEQERHRTRIKRIDTEYDACRLAAGGLSLGICVVACSAVAVVTNVLAPLTFGACVASCSVAGTWTGGGIACRYDRDKHMSWEEKMHDANVRGCLLGYKMCLWWVAHGVRRWS